MGFRVRLASLSVLHQLCAQGGDISLQLEHTSRHIVARQLADRRLTLPALPLALLQPNQPPAWLCRPERATSSQCNVVTTLAALGFKMQASSRAKETEADTRRQSRAAGQRPRTTSMIGPTTEHLELGAQLGGQDLEAALAPRRHTIGTGAQLVVCLCLSIHC